MPPRRLDTGRAIQDRHTTVRALPRLRVACHLSAEFRHRGHPLTPVVQTTDFAKAIPHSYVRHAPIENGARGRIRRVSPDTGARQRVEGINRVPSARNATIHTGAHDSIF